MTTLNVVEITRRFRFEAMHWLPGHPKCGWPHGHSYILEVTVAGPINESGMVVDFGELKNLMAPILKDLDHGCLNVWLNGGVVHKYSGIGVGFDIRVGKDLNPASANPVPPTAENLVVAIRRAIFCGMNTAETAAGNNPFLGVELVQLSLWETADSWCTWRADAEFSRTQYA